MPQRRTGTDDRVMAELQQSLVELIDLALTGKQAHWNVVGPMFRPVHQQLDEIVQVARDTSDEIAERMAALGGVPDGLAGTVTEAKTFDAFPAGQLSTDQVVELIGERLDALIARMRERIARLAESDPVSQGILIETSAQIEKQAWMLRAQRG
jgi:starvation-inducible DNA-binding protein